MAPELLLRRDSSIQQGNLERIGAVWPKRGGPSGGIDLLHGAETPWGPAASPLRRCGQVNGYSGPVKRSKRRRVSGFNHRSTMKLDEMASEVTFLRMPRSKPKTSAEGQEQLSNSLARMASTPVASKRVPITEVGFAQCRFVVDDRSFPALCCGEPTLGGSWCAQHRALVFVRVAAPNHRKPAQEPPKALSGTAKPVPNGPAKPPDDQAAAPAREKPPSLDKQKPKPPHVAPPAESGGTPAKGPKPSANKPPAPASAVKDVGSGTAQAGAHKEGVKASLKGAGKQAKAAVAKGGRSAPAKKPEPSRKSAVKPSPRKAPSPKGAAKPSAATKKAAAGKGSAAKRSRAATKAAESRKGSAAKRSPAKKLAASRKGASAKQRTSAKKTTVAGKRKTR
jgi:hypothetical protein